VPETGRPFFAEEEPATRACRTCRAARNAGAA
jgi:hypothetical protein